ncbi:hypothetical protein [Devosia sp. DBB001]|nr:hypothetical protein [Devosia sp. DBB001]
MTAISIRLSALRREFVLARDGQRPFTEASAKRYLSQLDELCRDAAKLEAGFGAAGAQRVNRRGQPDLTNFSIVRRAGGANV